MDYHLPQTSFKLPETPQSFDTPEKKGAFVNEVMQTCQQATLSADKNWNAMNWGQAHAEYLVSLEGFMSLMKVTQDDANFQNYLKNQLNYLFKRGEQCKAKVQSTMQDRKIAGYVTNQDRPDFKNAYTNLVDRQMNAGRSNDPQMRQDVNDMLKDIQSRGQQALEDPPVNIPSPSQAPINKPSNSDNGNSGKQEESKGNGEQKKSSVDPEVLRSIEETILDSSPDVHWDDVKGLEDVKRTLNETIVLPTLKPEIFKGLLSPSKGILLYGPPGNGKTMLAKAIATECKSTFFNCSASTLTSKWMGEGEKLMRALFTLANERAPAVIFMDEIDSIMGARGGQEHEASRRLKTEFLVQFDGVGSTGTSEKSILVLAATNRPQDLDEAALRRFTRRIFMPLPDDIARQAMIEHKMKDVRVQLNEEENKELIALTERYSCADLNTLVKEAAMCPVRELSQEDLMKLTSQSDVRPIGMQDFKYALKQVAPSVSKQTLEDFKAWEKEKSGV